MQGVNIAKASAAREKLLEAIQELTESGEIIWVPRMPGYEGTKFFTYIHLVTDALGWVAFGFGESNNKLEFDTSKAADNLSLAISHQKGRSWSGNVPNPVQEQYARELAARRSRNSDSEVPETKRSGELVLRDRRASQTEKDGTKRFYLEPLALTGLTDVISVQNIGRYGDNIFVIEAETEDEAMQKLLDLLENRVWAGEVRPATEDEGKEFEMWQEDAKRSHEIVVRILEENRVKGVGK